MSVSAFAIMSSLSIMPMLVTHCEMENCLWDFNIPNQNETSLNVVVESNDFLLESSK